MVPYVAERGPAMATKLIPLVCPRCGGALQIPEDADKVFCTYCGTQIIVDDDAVTVHMHNYDEAALRRLELEEQRRERELLAQERLDVQVEAYRKKWRIAFIGYFVVVALLLTVTSLLPKDTTANKTVSALAGFVLLFAPIPLFVLRPKRYERKHGG